MVCFISFRFWLKKSIHMLAVLTLILCYRKIECSWSEKIFITIYLKFLHLLSRNLSFYYKSDRWLINQPTLCPITLSVEWKRFLLFIVCFISFRFWLKKSIHMLAVLTLILCYRKIECSWSEKIFITIYLKFLHLLSRNLSFYYKSDRWLINQLTLWSLNCANCMSNCDKKNWFILFRT